MFDFIHLFLKNCSLPENEESTSTLNLKLCHIMVMIGILVIIRAHVAGADLKLDGVGPVDNRPSTDKLHHIVKKKKMWYLTRDTRHMTHDTWHMTHDMFGGVDILSKFQLPSSYCLWFMILWRSGGKGWLTDLISDKAVYRTAPATPGLLKIVNHIFFLKSNDGFWSKTGVMWVLKKDFILSYDGFSKWMIYYTKANISNLKKKKLVHYRKLI